jgi:SAM-dependent methyltransferase
MGWSEIARRRRWHKYESDAARHWDDVWQDHWRGKSFDSLLAEAHASVQLPFLARHLSRDGAVLESGCGHGQWLAALRRPGLRLVGLDRYADPMIRGLASDPALTFVQGDIARLPFASGSLAAGMSFGVLEHFEQGCDAQLAEMLRVLAPEGVLLVSVPYYSALRRALEPLRLVRERLHESRALRRLLGRADLPPRRFYQYAYTTREFGRVLARGGFRSQAVIHYDTEHGLVRDYAVLRALRRRAPGLFRALHRTLLAISPRVTAHMQMHAAAVGRAPA